MAKYKRSLCFGSALARTEGQRAFVHRGLFSYLVQFTRSLLRASPIPLPSFSPGQLELRGLAPGKYHVRDYAEGKDLGLVEVGTAGGVPRLDAEFKDHLLLEVGK